MVYMYSKDTMVSLEMDGWKDGWMDGWMDRLQSWIDSF
jgi:hypothetical protein